MTTLCEKYRPNCFSDVKGKDIEIQRIQRFINKFPEKKSLILYGAAGTGKTSLAYALASETNSEIIELNASDLRNREQIDRIMKQASQQKPLFMNKKILLIDEVDGISKDDRGGLLELISIIKESSYPVIITANNIWDKKFSDLRRVSELIEIKELDYRTVFKIIKEITEKEKLNLDDSMLNSIALKSRGDVRAAINDLQSLNQETQQKDMHERDKDESIFNVLKKVFQQSPNDETQILYDKVNMPLDEIYLWLEENIPKEYRGEELYNAIESLSKADVFRGRIYRQQHWRFLIYQNFLLSVGISAAKKYKKPAFVPYNRPSRILKIWLINQKQKYKKSISEKVALYTHISKKRAMKDFLLVKQLLQNREIQEKLKLDEKEVEFLKN